MWDERSRQYFPPPSYQVDPIAELEAVPAPEPEVSSWTEPDIDIDIAAALREWQSELESVLARAGARRYPAAAVR